MLFSSYLWNEKEMTRLSSMLLNAHGAQLGKKRCLYINS